MRVLALDIGRNKTGIAISEDMFGLVSPLEHLNYPINNNSENWFKELAFLLKKYPYELHEITTVVIGSWKDTQYRNKEMKCLVKQAVDVIKNKTDWEVVLIRETYTSVESKAALKAMGVGCKRRYRSIDSYAASFLLIDYLELVKPMQEWKEKQGKKDENIR